jgi:hypothetical protein
VGSSGKLPPSEVIMKTDLSPTATWHGLPLSPAQNREVLNYIQRCERAGVAWDTPELRAMLHDMLDPPELMPDIGDEIAGCTENEYFAATHEEPGDAPPDDLH